MTAADRRLARDPGEGPTLALGPNHLTWKAIGADTDGHYAMTEFVTMPGTGAGWHAHHREDESFYVLEGTLTIYLDDKVVRAQPGSYVLIPKGLRHAFVNRGAEPVRSLITLSPAGLEGFFEAVAGPNAPQTADQLAALAAPYQLEFLGPLPPE